MAKVDVLHVPFNGSAPAIQALLGGNVDLMFDTAVTALPLIKSGKVVVLGVSSAKRTRLAPELPTVGEAIPGFEADSWNGLMAPAGTPPEIVDRIQREVAKIRRHAGRHRAVRQPRCRCGRQHAEGLRRVPARRNVAVRASGQGSQPQDRVTPAPPLARTRGGPGDAVVRFAVVSQRQRAVFASSSPIPLGTRWH